MTRLSTFALSALSATALFICGCGGETSTGSPGVSSANSTLPSYSVNLKTAIVGDFVTAENGGGGAINANRPVASTWETFTLYDLNGGTLQNGDLVYIGTLNNSYWSANNGGGSSLAANRTVASTWETFRVLIIGGTGGQVLASGNQIALQTEVSGDYVSAANGGGAGVTADRTAISGWESFFVTIKSSSGGTTSGGSAGGLGGAQCSGAELSKCNCPTGYYCCPTDGSCFNQASQVIYTQCNANESATCMMGGSTTTSGGGTAGGGGSAGGGGTTTGTLPTRLRIVNNCSQNVWIAHDSADPNPQNIELGKGQSHDYAIPTGGVAAVRYWPKIGCDSTGHNCSIGDNGQGGGVPCPANGCQPPIDSKFEVTFAAVGGSAQTWYNISQVDGFTLPFKVQPMGDGANSGACVASDCGNLNVNGCPGSDNLSEGGAFPQYAAEDERVRDSAGNVIGCISPCKKLNYPAPWGAGLPESTDPALHMCCPTPIDPSTGQCTVANGCMTSQACSNAGDARSVVHTSYVAAVHSMCPSAYSYAYDDANGLHTCPSDTQFEVTFCP